MTIRVLVADDQALVRAGIRMLIETQPDLEVVGEAADGMAAVSEVTRLTGWLTRPPRFWLGSRSWPCSAAREAALAGAAVTG